MSADLPMLTLIFMWVSALVCLALPIVLMFVLKKKGADILPFFIGFAVFALFALTIEGLINYAVSRSAFGKRLFENPILYAVYGGLMAGLFEETGRFLAFRTVLRKKLGNDKNALMYGAGHGGFEAIMLVSVSYVTYSAMIILNSLGTLSQTMPAEALEQVLPVLDQMTGMAPAMLLMSVVERSLAIVSHIALSVFVWFSVKNSKKLYLFPAAILLHALLDFFAVIASQALELPTAATEGVFALCVVLLALAAWKVWKANTGREELTNEP